MALTLLTNTSSLIASHHLAASTRAFGDTVERLASGKRINAARDNVAGQAIANRMTARIKSLQQASRNANDGISLAQTAEGALNHVSDNLQRIRTLSVQAASETTHPSDRQSIQNEIERCLDEIDRTCEQTAFNGMRLFDGTRDTIRIQAGADQNQTLAIDLGRLNTTTLSLRSTPAPAPDIDVTAVAVEETTSAHLGEQLALQSPYDRNFLWAFFQGRVDDGVFARADGTGYVVKDNNDDYFAAAITAGGIPVWNSQSSRIAEGEIDVARGEIQSIPTKTPFDTSALAAGQAVHAYTGAEADAPAFVIRDDSGSEDFYSSPKSTAPAASSEAKH